jgi:outer membrane protein TolC
MRHRPRGAAGIAVLVLVFAGEALAAETPISRRAGSTPAFSPSESITYAQALERAGRVAPDVAIARSREAVARAEVGIAGVLPNPSASLGTNTQTARLTAGVSVPLVILGQRGAAVDASRAELATTRVETEIATVDVRAAVAHSYVALWRAQGIAGEEARAAAVALHLENAVAGRVELGAAANVDGLRARAERLRADAAAQQATQLVVAAGSDLGRWLGLEDGSALRPQDAPAVPNAAPPLAELRARIDASPNVRRERADRAAAEARAARERALVRPTLSLDLGLDAYDQTLCPNGPCSNPPVNYRGAIGIDLPILNQRGPYIEREQAAAEVARTRELAEHVRLAAALTSAYRTYEAWTASARALADGVVPAANAAAVAAEESYAMGRAPLVAVLEAEKARIEASLSLLDARAQQADAWIDVERAVGGP